MTLWLILTLLMGGAALIGYWMLIRKRAETVPAAPETLSEAEREELQAILTKVQRS
jgi:uncharacterized membrane protein